MLMPIEVDIIMRRVNNLMADVSFKWSLLKIDMERGAGKESHSVARAKSKEATLGRYTTSKYAN